MKESLGVVLRTATAGMILGRERMDDPPGWIPTRMQLGRDHPPGDLPLTFLTIPRRLRGGRGGFQVL